MLIWCRKGEAPGLIPWLERISQGWAEVLVVRFEPHGARVSPF